MILAPAGAPAQTHSLKVWGKIAQSAQSVSGFGLNQKTLKKILHWREGLLNFTPAFKPRAEKFSKR
jgi:hypothetical protein